MKRFSILFVLVLLTLTQGSAQQHTGIEVSLSSGYVLPASPMTFSNYWKMQYGGALGVGMPLSETVTLFGSVEYYKFALKPEGVSSGFNTEYMRDIWVFTDVSMNPTADPSSVISASANIRVAPAGVSGWLSPYVTAGVGVMSLSLAELSLPTTSVIAAGGSTISMTALQNITGGKETSALVQFGVGIEAHLSAMVDAFVEARYTHGMSKGLGSSYIPLTAGLKFHL